MANDRDFEIQVTAADAAVTGETLYARTRANLSIGHLLAAASFARATGAIEASHAGEALGPFWDEIQSNAIACVLTAWAGLEAYANELFVDHAEVFPDLRRDVMEKLWELYEMKGVLEKFEFALFLRQAPSLERGASPYQDVSALGKLRNALVHFKPEWSDQQVAHAQISRITEHYACRSPFFPANEPLFPTAWASHGSAVWTVRSAVEFLQKFEDLLNVKSRIQPFLPRLNAL